MVIVGVEGCLEQSAPAMLRESTPLRSPRALLPLLQAPASFLQVGRLLSFSCHISYHTSVSEANSAGMASFIIGRLRLIAQMGNFSGTKFGGTRVASCFQESMQK